MEINSKAVVYVRVSSKEQEREGFSIPAQKQFLRSYAIDKGLTVVKVFEESESAKRAGRTQFKVMMNFLKDNPDVRHVLVEKTDRLYRNIKDYNDLNYEELGLQIHLAKESEILSKDSRSHQKFIHGIKVLMAKNYSDNLSEEVIKGMTQKASEGLWPSMAPLGYINDRQTHTIEPDPKYAPIITKAFQLGATGQLSLSKLKRNLYEMGLRSARSKAELSKSQMHRVLTNPIYYGDFFWKGQYHRGKHQPLTTKIIFDQVQEQMGFVKKARQTKKNFAFTGLLTCAHCGCSITAQEKRKKSGRTYVYYHCTSGKGACEGLTYVREEFLEQEFAIALSKLNIPQNVIDWTKEALLETHKEEVELHDAKISSLETRYKSLQRKINSSYEDKLENLIDHDFWAEQNSRWKQEQTEIEVHLEALRKTNSASMDQGLKLMELAKSASSLFTNMTADEKREMLSLVLSNPRMLNGSIQYDFKKPFSLFQNVADLNEWRGGRDSNPRPPP